MTEHYFNNLKTSDFIGVDISGDTITGNSIVTSSLEAPTGGILTFGGKSDSGNGSILEVVNDDNIVWGHNRNLVGGQRVPANMFARDDFFGLYSMLIGAYISGSNIRSGVDLSTQLIYQHIYTTDAYYFSQRVSGVSTGSVITNPGNIIMHTDNTHKLYFMKMMQDNIAPPGGVTLQIGTGGQLGPVTSTLLAKMNVDYDIDTSWIYDIKPCSFKYRKTDKDNKYTDECYDSVEYGVIAEDLEKVNKELCTYDENDKLKGVQYIQLIAPIINEMKLLKKRIEELEAK